MLKVSFAVRVGEEGGMWLLPQISPLPTGNTNAREVQEETPCVHSDAVHWCLNLFRLNLLSFLGCSERIILFAIGDEDNWRLDKRQRN